MTVLMERLHPPTPWLDELPSLDEPLEMWERAIEPLWVGAWSRSGLRTTRPYRKNGGTYVVRLGPYLKIGHTGNIAYRLTQLPYEEVIATFASQRIEFVLHEAFENLRVDLPNGMREWFQDSPVVRRVLEILPTKYGREARLA